MKFDLSLNEFPHIQYGPCMVRYIWAMFRYRTGTVPVLTIDFVDGRGQRATPATLCNAKNVA